MKKDIIFFKLIAKQKSIIPIVLLTSIGMGFLHRNIENSFLLNIIWAFILSGVILLFSQKGLINWGNKPLFQKIKEGSLILLGSFLVFLIPITFIVMIGLFFVQIYLVTVLSESGDESTPFIKNKITTIKLSDEERKSFNISQKLNYPEPDSEMELAITQNELKMQEILQAKEDLEKNIADKESEINRIQQEMENNSDYQYAQSLKETIQKSKREKDNLLNKRSQLMMQKQSLEKQLKIQQIKLEHKQREAEQLTKERNNLKDDLKEKEEYLKEEKRKKEALELEQKILKEKLNEKYKQIDELNFSKDQEIDTYKQKLQYLEKEKNELEDRYGANETKILNLVETVEKYEREFAQTQLNLKEKDKRLSALIKENEQLSIDYQDMRESLERKDNDLNDYEKLLADNDKEHDLLKKREKELEEKQQEIEKMHSKNEDLKGQLQFFITKYEELKSTEQQNLVYLTRIEGNKSNGRKQSVKSDIKERFNELYTDLVIEDYFYSQFKDLSKKEQYEVEKQLIYLNYGFKDKLKFRDKSVLMPKGPALNELVYRQKDKNGVGEGRIYIRNRHVYALSSDHKEATRVIKKLKSGVPEHRA